VLACYLVRYEGRYSAWITSANPGDRSQAYAMPSEPAGRALVDAWQATNAQYVIEAVLRHMVQPATRPCPQEVPGTWPLTWNPEPSLRVPPDQCSGVRVGICVRVLKFGIHPAFPVLF
jgi:hypothetical protein